VIAAVGGPDRLARVESLHADLVVDYGSDPGWPDTIRARFPDGVTLAVDPAGNPDVWQGTIRALGRRGRIAVCGAHAGPIVELDLAWLFRTRTTVIGCSGSTIAGVRQIVSLAGEGRVRPAIDSVRPLDDVHAAFGRLLARENRGKVVLEVTGSRPVDDSRVPGQRQAPRREGQPGAGTEREQEQHPDRQEQEHDQRQERRLVSISLTRPASTWNGSQPV
jgi:hypothetical protein